MAGRSKIVDEGEVIRWIEEGRTYRWMVETYAEKYNLEVGITMFSQFRRRRGLDPRIVRDDKLIPWALNPEHRHGWYVNMLRLEARSRVGAHLSESEQESLAGFRRNLEREGAVVHYDPDTEQGWFLVPRREGIDLDLIHEPVRPTTKRPSVN